jgi:hypothetical protein
MVLTPEDPEQFCEYSMVYYSIYCLICISIFFFFFLRALSARSEAIQLVVEVGFKKRNIGRKMVQDIVLFCSQRENCLCKAPSPACFTSARGYKHTYVSLTALNFSFNLDRTASSKRSFASASNFRSSSTGLYEYSIFSFPVHACDRLSPW